MKKILFAIFSAAFVAALSAQHYEKPDREMSAEELKMTAEAAPKKLAVEPKKVRRFLVWDRTQGARHESGIPAFKAYLEVMEKNSKGKWQMVWGTEEDAGKYFGSVEKLKEFDCVILNNTTGRFFESFADVQEKMTPAQREEDKQNNFKYRDNLIEYVRQGGGVMGVHAATDSMNVRDPKNPDEKSPAFPNFIGGHFAGHPWNGGNSPVTVVLEDPEHPLVKGIWPDGEFKVQDEIYTFRSDEPEKGITYGFDRGKQRVLMDLDFDRSPRDGGEDPMNHTSRKTKDFGLVWIKEVGKGRIFYGAFGDRFHVYYRNPGIAELYMRGLQYASGDLKADATPLGMDGFDRAMARASVVGVKSLRNLEYGDKIDVAEKVFFRAYKAIGESKAASGMIEKLCVEELKAKAGTNRYLKFCSELLQVTGANSTAVEVGEIIARDSADKDYKTRYYTESLFIALARSTDPAADEVLKKLSSSKTDYIARDAVMALGYRKDPKNANFIWEKYASAKDFRMQWCAISALAKTKTPEVYSRLVSAYASAKNPVLKNQIGELVVYYSEIDPKLSAGFISKIVSDKGSTKNLLTLAANELVRQGKVPEGVLLQDVISFLGINRDVKIPAQMELSKLAEEYRPWMIYTLVQRNEGRDAVSALKPGSAETAVALTYAFAQWGMDGQIEKALSFAPLYNDYHSRYAAFILSSINSKNKLEAVMETLPKLDDKSKAYGALVLGYLDASASVDYLFKKVLGNADLDTKKNALRVLNNAALKNEEVFVKTAAVYDSLPEALKRDAMVLMVNCSRRECTDKMVQSAQALMDAAKTPQEKVRLFRFASANMSGAGADMLVYAYRQGLKSEVLKDFADWTSPAALTGLMALDKASKDPKERQAIQKAMLAVIPNADAYDTEGAEYLLKNAVDKKDAALLQKMKRLNFSGRKPVDLGGGIFVTVCENEAEAKRMLDSKLNDKWATKRGRTAGDWVQFSFEKEKFVSAVRLELGGSKNDGLYSPKLFGGMTIEDFDEIQFTHEKGDDYDILRLKKPMKLKMLRIEQGESGGNWWTIAEVDFQLDSSVYKAHLKPYGNGMQLGSSDGEDSIKNLFDGNEKTRWSTGKYRTPGMWFLIGFDKPRTVSEVSLILKSSVGDRVRSPKIFAGESLESMVPANAKYQRKMDRDTFEFSDPAKVKYIRIENGEAAGNWWSFHELEIK